MEENEQGAASEIYAEHSEANSVSQSMTTEENKEEEDEKVCTGGDTEGTSKDVRDFSDSCGENPLTDTNSDGNLDASCCKNPFSERNSDKNLTASFSENLFSDSKESGADMNSRGHAGVILSPEVDTAITLPGKVREEDGGENNVGWTQNDREKLRSEDCSSLSHSIQTLSTTMSEQVIEQETTESIDNTLAAETDSTHSHGDVPTDKHDVPTDIQDVAFHTQEDVPTDRQDGPTDSRDFPTGTEEDVFTDAREYVSTDSREDVSTGTKEEGPTDSREGVPIETQNVPSDTQEGIPTASRVDVPTETRDVTFATQEDRGADTHSSAERTMGPSSKEEGPIVPSAQKSSILLDNFPREDMNLSNEGQLAVPLVGNIGDGMIHENAPKGYYRTDSTYVTPIYVRESDRDYVINKGLTQEIGEILAEKSQQWAGILAEPSQPKEQILAEKAKQREDILSEQSPHRQEILANQSQQRQAETSVCPQTFQSASVETSGGTIGAKDDAGLQCQLRKKSLDSFDEKDDAGYKIQENKDGEKTDTTASSSSESESAVFDMDVKNMSDKELLNVCRRAIKKSAWRTVIYILREAGPFEDEKRLKMCFWGAKWQGAWNCLTSILALTERDSDVTNYLVNDLSKLMADYASGGALRCRAFLKHLHKKGYTTFAFDLALTFGDWETGLVIISDVEARGVEFQWMLLDVASLVTVDHVTKFVDQCLQAGHSDFAMALGALWRKWPEVLVILKEGVNKANPFKYMVFRSAITSGCWEAVNCFLTALSPEDIDRELHLLPRGIVLKPLLDRLASHDLLLVAMRLACLRELWYQVLHLLDKFHNTDSIAWLARRVFEADISHLEDFVGKGLDLELKRTILGRPGQLPFTRNQWDCVMRLVDDGCLEQHVLQWITRRAVEEDCYCLTRLIGHGDPPVDLQLMSLILKSNNECGLSDNHWACVEELLQREVDRKPWTAFENITYASSNRVKSASQNSVCSSSHDLKSHSTEGDFKSCNDVEGDFKARDDESVESGDACLLFRDSIKVEKERRQKQEQTDFEANRFSKASARSSVPELRFENELSEIACYQDVFERDELSEDADAEEYFQDPWNRVVRLVQSVEGRSQYIDLLAQRAAREEKWLALKWFTQCGLEENPLDLIFQLKHRLTEDAAELEKARSRSEPDGLLDYEYGGVDTRWTSFDFHTLDSVHVICFRGNHNLEDDLIQDRHRIVLLRRAVATGQLGKVEELVSQGLYPSQRPWVYRRVCEAGWWELALQVLDQGLERIPANIWVKPSKPVKGLSHHEAMFVERGLCNPYFTKKLYSTDPLAEDSKERSTSPHKEGGSSNELPPSLRGEVLQKDAQNAPRKSFNFFIKSANKKDSKTPTERGVHHAAPRTTDVYSHSDSNAQKHKNFPNMFSGMKKITFLLKHDTPTVGGKTSARKLLKHPKEFESKLAKAASKGEWPLVMSLYRAGLKDDVKMAVYDEAVCQQQWHVAVALIRHDPEASNLYHHYKKAIFDPEGCVHPELLEALSGMEMPAEDRDMFAELCLLNRWWPQLLILTRVGISADWKAKVLDEVLLRNEWTFVYELLQAGCLTKEEKITVLQQAIAKGIWPVVTSLVDRTVSRALVAAAILRAVKAGKGDVVEACIRSSVQGGGGRSVTTEPEVNETEDVCDLDMDSVRDEDGSTALQLAAWRGLWPVVKLFLDLGANPDPEPTPACPVPVLVKAAQKQQPQMVADLLKAGAKAVGRETALHELLLRDSLEDEILPVIREMLRKGADPTAILCEEIPFTPLRSALECDRIVLSSGRRLSDEVLRILIDAGASASQMVLSDSFYDMPPSEIFKPHCIIPPFPCNLPNPLSLAGLALPGATGKQGDMDNSKLTGLSLPVPCSVSRNIFCTTPPFQHKKLPAADFSTSRMISDYVTVSGKSSIQPERLALSLPSEPQATQVSVEQSSSSKQQRKGEPTVQQHPQAETRSQQQKEQQQQQQQQQQLQHSIGSSDVQKADSQMQLSSSAAEAAAASQSPSASSTAVTAPLTLQVSDVPVAMQTAWPQGHPRLEVSTSAATAEAPLPSSSSADQAPPVPPRCPLPPPSSPTPRKPRPISTHRLPPPPPSPVTPSREIRRRFDGSVADLLTNNCPLYLYVHGYAGCSPMKKALDMGRLSTVKLLHQSGACSNAEIRRWYTALLTSSNTCKDVKLREVFEYVKKVVNTPASLKHQCRLFVSRTIGWRDRRAKIKSLPLTPELRDLVTFRDVLSTAERPRVINVEANR